MADRMSESVTVVRNLAASFCGRFSSVEYVEKSKHLQEQLKELRSEIEVLKVDEKQSHMDEIHDQNVLHGSGKYTTIGRVCYCRLSKSIHSTCYFIVSVFFFPDHIALIDLSKNLPFFFTAQNNPIKMHRVLFLRSDLSRSTTSGGSKCSCQNCQLFPFISVCISSFIQPALAPSSQTNRLQNRYSYLQGSFHSTTSISSQFNIISST